MLAPWASEEMKTAKLRDKRLNMRLTRILSALGERTSITCLPNRVENRACIG